VSNQSGNASSSGSDQKGIAADQSGNSDSANAAVQAKVESVEDHKKLNCLGKRNVYLKHYIHTSWQCLLMSLDRRTTYGTDCSEVDQLLEFCNVTCFIHAEV